MFKKILILSALVFSACSSVEDVPLPITTSSEKALELYNEALEYRKKWEGREARQKMAFPRSQATQTANPVAMGI